VPEATVHTVLFVLTRARLAELGRELAVGVPMSATMLGPEAAAGTIPPPVFGAPRRRRCGT
jgi:hypothetical protein